MDILRLCETDAEYIKNITNSSKVKIWTMIL